MVRFKNRWLLVELLPEGLGHNKSNQVHFDSKQIWASIKQSVQNNFGDVGWGAVALSLTVKYYSPVTNICIIRISRDHHKIAWGAVTLLTAIDGHRVIPNVVHLSGTIRKAQIAAIEHNRTVIARYRALAKLPATYRDSYDTYLDTSNQEIEALQD